MREEDYWPKNSDEPIIYQWYSWNLRGTTQCFKFCCKYMMARAWWPSPSITIANDQKIVLRFCKIVCSAQVHSCSIGVHSCLIGVHSCSICVLSCSICVHSCSTCVHSCSICVHSCSTCVHSCSICVHSCSTCVHSCSICVHSW